MKKALGIANAVEATPPVAKQASSGSTTLVAEAPATTRRRGKKGTDVEAQAEAARADSRTIWSAVFNNDEALLKELLAENPDLAYERGPVGELPLHLCFLFRNFALGHEVLRMFPSMVTAVYEGEQYRGENCLHIAIVNRDFEQIRYLLELGSAQEQLNTCATGNFFSLGHVTYYGEYPLSFAACSKQRDVVRYLVENGADFCARDSNGNNVFHLMVIHELDDMFDFLVELYESQQGDSEDLVPPWKHLNSARMTAFTLSAHRGSFKMFSFFVKRNRKKQWSYGPVTALLYPLDELDIPVSIGGKQTISAMDLIVREGHRSLLKVPIVAQLLTKKWARFARRRFFIRFVLSLLYFVVFAIAVLLRSQREVNNYSTTPSQVRLALEAVVVAGAVYKLAQEVQEMRTIGFRRYIRSSGSHRLENLTSLVFGGFIVGAFFFRVIGSSLEIPCTAVASVAGWLYMLHFLFAFKLTGVFVILLLRMVTLDVTRFMVMYICIFLGFTQAFHILFVASGQNDMWARLRESFLVLIADVDFDLYLTVSFPFVSGLLLLFYVIFTAVLALNILIAAMSETYSTIVAESEEEYFLEYARLIRSIESEMGSVIDDPSETNPYKYWVVAEGHRFLYVEEVDDRHWDRDRNGEIVTGRGANNRSPDVGAVFRSASRDSLAIDRGELVAQREH